MFIILTAWIKIYIPGTVVPCFFSLELGQHKEILTIWNTIVFSQGQMSILCYVSTSSTRHVTGRLTTAEQY